MLRSVSLTNFRGFSEHRIEFGKEAILIGQNNAGKTTAIEALRVLSVAQLRLHTAQFAACPQWLDRHCKGPGFRFSLETIDFDFANVQHSYDTARPAIIRAKLANNNEIDVYIGQDSTQIFCQLRKGPRTVIFSKKDITTHMFGATKVMPPVGSLLPRERSIAKDRLNKYLDGYLAYRHFRNQLWEKPPEYKKFKQLLEDTWPGLIIQHFENDHGDSQNEFSLLIREGRFTSEISWHGHGLQAWMQTAWFLSRVSRSATIVLDEPDVYLHADLQRKLIKVIESMDFKQSIIATHSSEIISDVPFSNVIVVQKKDKVSKSATNAEQIQECLIRMGSLHSIQLAKIAQQGVVLLVEGDDKPYLSDIAYKLGPQKFDHFARLAIQDIGGKANWKEALGASKALYDASSGSIRTALLLDRDYMTDEEVKKYQSLSIDSKLILKIWKKKEIENYFIVPKAISRIICDRDGSNPVDIEPRIEKIISDIEDEIKIGTVLRFAQEIQERDKKIGIVKANELAEQVVNRRINDGQSIRDMHGGKKIFAKLSAQLQVEFGTSVSALAVCKEAKLSELCDEVREFVGALCGGTKVEPGKFDMVFGESKPEAVT